MYRKKHQRIIASIIVILLVVAMLATGILALFL